MTIKDPKQFVLPLIKGNDGVAIKRWAKFLWAMFIEMYAINKDINRKVHYIYKIICIHSNYYYIS